MESKIIYRIEHSESKAGMWYNFDGSYNGTINTLTDGKSKAAPMPKPNHPELGNKKWFSAASDLENLLFWFSPLDIQELFNKGYILYKIECTDWIDIGTEILFTRESIITKTIEELVFNENQ